MWKRIVSNGRKIQIDFETFFLNYKKLFFKTSKWKVNFSLFDYYFLKIISSIFRYCPQYCKILKRKTRLLTWVIMSIFTFYENNCRLYSQISGLHFVTILSIFLQKVGHVKFSQFMHTDNYCIAQSRRNLWVNLIAS